MTTPDSTHRRNILLCVQLTPEELETLRTTARTAGFDATSKWVRLVLHQALAGRDFTWTTRLRPATDGSEQYRFRVGEPEHEAIKEMLTVQASGAEVYTPSTYLTALVLSALDQDITGWRSDVGMAVGAA